MNTENNHVGWPVFLLVVSLSVGIFGILYAKLEKIDDAIGNIRADIATLKIQIQQTLTIKQ